MIKDDLKVVQGWNKIPKQIQGTVDMDKDKRERKPYVPYGYRLSEKGLEADPYQSKVLKLIFELIAAGMSPDNLFYIIFDEFKVPKLEETRPIDFEELKQEILRYVQAGREEEGMTPLELELKL